MLDLRGQAQRDGAAAPLVHVGVGPVRDDDVRQRVGRVADRPHHLRVRRRGQEQFEETVGVPVIGYRGDDPDQRTSPDLHARPLGADDVVVQGAAQRDAPGGFVGLDAAAHPRSGRADVMRDRLRAERARGRSKGAQVQILSSRPCFSQVGGRSLIRGRAAFRESQGVVVAAARSGPHGWPSAWLP